MESKFAFGSPDWLLRLKAAFEAAASSRSPEERELRYSLCEVYLEPPHSLGGEDGKLSWHVLFTPDGAEWKPGELESADILIRGRYRELAELGRIVVDGDPDKRTAMDNLIRAARKSGNLTYRNTLGLQPQFTAGVHDEMARITQG